MAGPSRYASAPARLYAEWLAVAAAATLLVVALTLGDLTARIDNILYDHAILAGERPPPDDIVIVAIDDRSLQTIGRWPWSRAVHTRAIEHIAATRPRAIGYDVLFVEPTADDARLASAIAKIRTWLPLEIDIPGMNGAPFDAVLPVPPLLLAAAGIGHVNISFDDDRVIRQIYLEEGGGGRSWLQLAALMAGMTSTDAVPREAGFFHARPMLIPYGGGAGHIRTISFADILEDRVPAEFLRDHYVLIGATANGLGDSYPTPTTGKASQMAGVEIQAHLLDALLRGRTIAPASLPIRLGVALGGLWLLLATFLRMGPRANARLAIGLVFGLLAASFLLLWFARFWLPPAPAVFAILFVYPLWGWRRLQAVSSFMTDELRTLAAEQDEFPRADGEVPSPREVTWQITLLGAAVDRLRDLRKFLADSVRHLPDAMFVTDLEGHLLLTNGEGRLLLRRLSIDAGQGALLQPLFARLRYADGNPALAPFDARAAREAQAEATIGDLGSFDIRYVSQADANDRRVGLIFRLVDLSRLKQAERHREEALQLLSHDMRAPQSAILSILESGGSELPAAMAARIEKQARRTLDLAEDFVQLARAEAKPLAIEELDVIDIVIDAADDLWAPAQARAIHIDVIPDEEFALVLADRQLLTRAIVNLIGNAIKYSEDGSTIRCTVEHNDSAMIRIAIADNGTGMNAEQLANLFQRFQQGPREGVGLGLAFVKLAVERHGGTIDCESQEGIGTTFTIDLPALPAEEILTSK